MPFVGVEGPWIAFLSVVFCQLEEAKILNVLIITYVFVVFSSTKNTLLFVWLWKIFSGCYGVSLHNFVGCIAKCNGFLRTLLTLNLFLELSDFVWFIILLNPE